MLSKHWKLASLALVAAAVLIISITLVPRFHEAVANRRSEERLRELRYYLLERMKDDPNATPTFPAKIPLDEVVSLESGKRITIRELLTEDRSGLPFVYRAVTPAGESIVFDPNDSAPGERFIVWAPIIDRYGRRIILTDSLLVRQIHSSHLNFESQSVLQGTEKVRDQKNRD